MSCDLLSLGLRQFLFSGVVIDYHLLPPSEAVPCCEDLANAMSAASGETQLKQAPVSQYVGSPSSRGNQFSVGIFSAWSTTIISMGILRTSSLSPSFSCKTWKIVPVGMSTTRSDAVRAPSPLLVIANALPRPPTASDPSGTKAMSIS